MSKRCGSCKPKKDHSGRIRWSSVPLEGQRAQAWYLSEQCVIRDAWGAHTWGCSSKKKEATPSKRPRAIRKGSLTHKLERTSPKVRNVWGRNEWDGRHKRQE
eukprot:scaffold59513_cov21-Tisochrysis_lutea.AAC.1